MTEVTMKIAKNLTLMMMKPVTGENEIRAECVMDAANPEYYVALYLSPDSFEMFFCAILLMLESLLCCYSLKVFSPDFHII